MVDAAASALAVEGYKDARGLFSYFHRRYDYAKNLKKNYKKLQEEASKLHARRNHVVAKATEDPRKQAGEECEDWISRVNKAENDVLDLKTQYEKLETHNRIWHITWRSNLSKLVADKSEELNRLWADGKFELEMVVKKMAERVRKIYPPKTEGFPSLHGIVREVIDLLEDKGVNRIGLWGMVGTGKTTILQNLNDNEKIATAFDIVIWVTVKKDWSIEKLQHVIAERLDLNIEGIEDANGIAWRISEALQSCRYLLLLDEVPSDINLHALGIRKNPRDGKVVLATRYRNICHDMNVDQLINVKRLPDNDARKMFREKVGGNINRPGIAPIAWKVVNECAGVPLLIDKVAKTFRKKEDNQDLWEYGLESLRKWHTIKTQGINEVLEFLEFCYDDLDCEKKKVCFLYGALYPEDFEICIDYLLECWRAEGFLTNADEFRGACGEGHEILADLIAVSLLERSDKLKHIKMNKVLRNMAIKISSQREDFKLLVRTPGDLQEPPNEEEWKQANRISLIMDNNLCSLPATPDCNNLSTLLLQRNCDLTIIPNQFFGYMGSLKVLDLQCTGITSLPPSLSMLTCLGALYLNSCECLKDFPPKVALENLEVLDIRGTKINLPIQIRGLNLRCLRVSLSKDMKIYHNVISTLYLLEELSIDVDTYDLWWDVVAKDITEEVATLRKLTSLSFCFPNADCLDIFIKTSIIWKNMHFRFRFSVGYHDPTRYEILDYFDYQMHKCLKVFKGEDVDPAISVVLAKSDVFELIGRKGVSKLSDFGNESTNIMRGCLIKSCNEIEMIIDANGTTGVALECLEKMYMQYLPNLKSIWEGPVHTGSLANVTTLSLYKCPEMKKIFSTGMIQQLSQLQNLIVEECPEIEELIMESENRGLIPSALPKLKTLVLVDLSKLRSIWIDDSLDWPSLERITVSKCSLLTRLPFNNDNATKLRCIEGQQSWWTSLQWKDVAAEQRLQSICIFTN